ncbi:MAG: urea ABC transporter ATP-binding protein UrtD [Alphaproteobacteria bacterium]|nr:urea ABC transporter ATP-binding protein UrtD [Alphaproteobacteria bacterium]
MGIILELKDLTKAYDTYAVVDHLNLQVNEGELRCLIGPNGAGKTTTMDLITGRQKTTGGQVIFDGRNITGLKEHMIVRRGIGRKFQVPAVFKDLTVRENLEVAFNRNPDPFANMLMMFRRTDKARFDEIVDLIGLGERLGERAGYLSHGETQWLEIGMVLTQNPRLLLMDEPTAGMTEQETHKTSQIFNRLRGSHTLVVVEHDMTFVREIADVISVLHMGKLLAQGTMAEVENDPKVREVYLGAEGISDAT